MTTNSTIVTVGTRVNCALHYCGTGTIYGITGEQTPHNVRSIFGGVGAAGGNADFDIVFDNGSKSNVPEAIVRGIQWQIYDEIVDAAFIDNALAHAEHVQDEKAREESLNRLAYLERLKELRTDPKLASLEQGDDKYSGKLAAKNIRTQLKEAFKGIKFSVRKSHYGSISICWTDGPTKSEVEAVTCRYKIGHFDSMQDLHTSTTTPWSQTFGGVDYMNHSREYSEEKIIKTLNYLADEYADTLNGKPLTLAMYRTGELTHVHVGCWNISRLVHEMMETKEDELGRD